MIEKPLLNRGPAAASAQAELRVGDEHTGVVVRWRHSGLGFGFIQIDGCANRDLFVHVSALQGEPYLAPGTRVRFIVAMDYKGRLLADRVDVLSRPPGVFSR